MATFAVTILPIKIEDHPNADAIECAVIGDYRSIIKKGQYNDGDLVAYIPEAAIVPDWILKKLGLWDNSKDKGILAGNAGNRVKSVRLRGILSEGLIYPVELTNVPQNEHLKHTLEQNTISIHCITLEDGSKIPVKEGDNISELLGITKWEPPIPIHMSGEVQTLHGHTMSYDIENYKRHPDILVSGEEVVMTEKLHGSWVCWGFHPHYGHIVSSKGLSSQGLCFKLNEANKDNLYLKTLMATTDFYTECTVAETAHRLYGRYDVPVYLLGEIIGKGIQDLHYGMTEPTFRLFDVYVGEPRQGQYLNVDELQEAADKLGLDMVPILYRGPFSEAVLKEHTNGKETISGGVNVREGIVVRAASERHDPVIGRVQLKSISDDYLLRKNATEYN